MAIVFSIGVGNVVDSCSKSSGTSATVSGSLTSNPCTTSSQCGTNQACSIFGDSLCHYVANQTCKYNQDCVNNLLCLNGLCACSV